MGIDIQFMNNEISRNTWHVGSNPCEDIDVSLEEGNQFFFEFGTNRNRSILFI